MDGGDEAQFPGIPPFPNTVPTAPLVRISLANLLARDAEEEDKLWNACCDLGFFYLDLRRSRGVGTGGAASGATNGACKVGSNGAAAEGAIIDGERLLADADALFDVAEEFFALPVEEKAKYDFSDQRSYFGYKGFGVGILDDKGSRDRNEFYNVSKDDILGISSPLPAPHLFNKHRALLRSYIEQSHGLIELILRFLEPRLQLPAQSLESLHRVDAVSGDQVRFIKAPPQPPDDRRTALGAHTDFGSVTVLFNRVGGLQVRLPASIAAVEPAVPGRMSEAERSLCTEGWAYVHPLPGHAIINLGDALVKFSAGILRSNIHRVVAPPGAQGDVTRYSLVYFSRPEDEVVLKALKDSPLIAERVGRGWEEQEEAVTSKEWILRRALGRREGKYYDPSKAKGTEEARGARG
ncbi:uncharacterized protein PV09_07891 [Verruconis gallopava]|uniref:Fe2OG dioxygenase domain-containing protein n=1 Tax=Verruconis gallopava TaxID=253628 RepID=A0A0D2AN51_9PEZI|nr:uncharacterized protein PV09_07891 [Verruconis gallopava]KIW00534.1 hypothetical protein PV09_07891 [Verruconis gallopava]